MAVVISDLRYCFAFKDRAAVKENLQVIFPEMELGAIKRIRRSMFRNFAKYLVDFFCFSKINQAYIKKKIQIKNSENFDSALSRKKGVIALTAHLGNWELGGVVLALLGYPLWAVVLEHKDKRVNEFFINQRESKGIKVIPLGGAARQCIKVLRENKILALVGDIDFVESGLEVDFFGRKTTLPSGPSVLALNTGAVIVPGFLVRNPDDSFTLFVERPLEYQPTGDKQKDCQRIIREYVAIFEKYIRRYPDQWYMFRRFWKE